MLIAYIDEVGEPGAFVSYDHAKFKTSPVFGYAGFVIQNFSVTAGPSSSWLPSYQKMIAVSSNSYTQKQALP